MLSRKLFALFIRFRTSSDSSTRLGVFVSTLAKIFEFGFTTAVAKKFLSLSCNSTTFPEVSFFVLLSKTNSLSYTHGKPARILADETFGFKRIIVYFSLLSIELFSHKIFQDKSLLTRKSLACTKFFILVQKIKLALTF